MRVAQTQLHRQAAHYSAIKLRLWGEPKRITRRVEFRLDSEPAKVSRYKATTRDQQNEYIKLRCRMLKTSYKDITAESMSKRVMEIRNQILLEVKERWPRVRADRLAEMFHRSHSAIRDALASLQGRSEKRPVTAETVEQMRRLRADGMLLSRIGKQFGVSETTDRYHLGKKESA